MSWPWSSKEKKLRKASRDGDVAAVRELLKKGNLDVDACDEEIGWNALHWASHDGNVQLVELLLKANASVEATDTFGHTPLDLAFKHLQVVEMLIKANASVDVRGDGKTPLHHASIRADAPVVEKLLKANAAVDAIDKGRTPLHYACSMQRPDVARMLLAAGANLNTEDKNGLKPLHILMLEMEREDFGSSTLETLQVLVPFGTTWDAMCHRLAFREGAPKQAGGFFACMSFWTGQLADGFPLTPIPIEVVRRGRKSTNAYIQSLKTTREVIFKRKVCLVGASCAGKTSFVKSIKAKRPQLVHLDNRTIGIDHFPLRFNRFTMSGVAIKTHEVTFWDFAGQDAYQVAHSLFFSPRTLFLVCVDLEAFTVAYLQASIMSDIKKQETQLMGEFIERTVMQWIRTIVARQPDAEFVFLATKEDLLVENSATERLLKTVLVSKLKEVEASTQEMRHKRVDNNAVPANDIAVSTAKPNVVFVSCSSTASAESARTMVEDLITKSDRSFQMPDAYTQALQAIVEMRLDAKTRDITTRIDRVFTRMDQLPTLLNLEPDTCRSILRTLHDLGDVLWYEDLGVELFQDRVILDPLLMIDFIRQVINHNYTGQTMSHSDLKALPYWNGFTDTEQMKAMKQVLQKFHLVYSADEDRTMSWDSDLIVPAYWKTKTPASWLFLGDVLRINDTKTFEGEAARVEWEYHFDFGLPASLFDHLVVASVSPFFTFDAGPDWIVYKEKGIAACRIMVGRDVKSLHRTMHVEAVVSDAATPKQVKALWNVFQHLVGTFVGVLREYPGLAVSSFAWDNANNKVGFNRLLQSSSGAPPMSVEWMPPSDTWASIKELMLANLKRDK